MLTRNTTEKNGLVTITRFNITVLLALFGFADTFVLLRKEVIIPSFKKKITVVSLKRGNS